MNICNYIRKIKESWDLSKPIEYNMNLIRTSIYKENILSMYNRDGRMLFYTKKTTRFTKWKNIQNNDLWLEANGLIIDVINVKPLVIPTKSFISHYDRKILNEFIESDTYDLFKIEDSTIINLYYFDKWIISTNRGIEMNNTVFNSYSYMEMLTEILNKKNIDIDEFFDSLDKNKCYTFNIKHNCIHKFNTEDNIWFINSTILDDISQNITDNYQNPKSSNVSQTVDTIENPIISQLSLIQIREPIPMMTLNDIININNDSLHNYLSEKKIDYGFIIKSKYPDKTGVYSNVIFESHLLERIRNLIYNSKFTKLAKENKINHDLAVCLSAYLDINNRNLFIKLFPQFMDIYNKLDIIVEKLIFNIITYNNRQNNEIIKHLYYTINNIYKICNNDESRHLIMNYLINTNNMNIFIRLYDNF